MAGGLTEPTSAETKRLAQGALDRVRFEEEALELSDQVYRVAERPGLAAYLASPRRIPFNQHGLFRSYPELDPGEA